MTHFKKRGAGWLGVFASVMLLFHPPGFALAAVGASGEAFPIAEQLDQNVPVSNPNADMVAQVFVASSTGAVTTLAVQDNIGIGGNLGIQQPTAVARIYDVGDPQLANNTNLIATSEMLVVPPPALVFRFPTHPVLEAGHTYAWIVSFGSTGAPGGFSNFSGSNANVPGYAAYAHFAQAQWQHGASLSPENYYFVLNGIPPAPESREPVVIVPGIMGSALVRASGTAEVWPNVNTMLLPGDAYLDDLSLSSSGTELSGKEMRASDVLREVTALGIFSKPLYGNLIDVFKNAGYAEGKDLFLFPYDWRLDLRAGMTGFQETVKSAIAASPNGKIIIVAHSAGGLLVKAYLAGVADTAFLEKLILVGVPELGAPEAFKTLNYGDNQGITVLDPRELKKISQNMPSVYELLPTRRYIAVAGGYVRDFRNGGAFLNYDETTAFMASSSADARNPALLKNADGFHGVLDARAPRAPQVYNIAGCFMPTIEGFDLYDGGVIDVRRTGGDGTVPFVSAMDHANAENNFFVLGNETGADHSGLVSDPRPLALIKAIAFATSTVQVPLEGISANTEDCFTPRAGAPDGAMIEIVVHGPAALDVADDAGNHTATLDDGALAVGVPGSKLERLGANTFALIPAARAKKVTIKKAAPGTLTVKVKRRAGARVEREIAFVKVPIQSASTTIVLPSPDPTSTTELSLDNNGDGVPDATLPPTVILDGTSTEDVAPPEITMPNIPAVVRRGSTSTIVFGAMDAGSGIASVEATLNGTPVRSGDTVTFTKLGKNIFTATATDKAGNPQSEELDFIVVERGRSADAGRGREHHEEQRHGKKEHGDSHGHGPHNATLKAYPDHD